MHVGALFGVRLGALTRAIFIRVKLSFSLVKLVGSESLLVVYNALPLA